MQDVRVCPRCGSGETKVYDSGREKFIMKRSRRCLDCGYVYKTVELLEREVTSIDIAQSRSGRNDRLEKLDSILKEYYKGVGE